MTCMLVGHIILLALFTALLLKNFETSTKEDSKQIISENREKTIEKIRNFTR